MVKRLVRELTFQIPRSIPGQILGHLAEEFVAPAAFAPEDGGPKLIGGRIENQFERGGKGQPRLAFHFVLQLAGRPAGVPGEQAHLFGGRKGFAHFNQIIERMAEGEVGQYVGLRQEGVGVKETEGAGLDRAAEVEGRIPEGIGQVGHDHLANLASERAVEHQAEGAIGVVLADEDDRALEKRAAQLPAIQQELALQKFRFVRHGLLRVMCLNWRRLATVANCDLRIANCELRNQPYPVGRVTPPDIGCRGPCAPSGDALPIVRPTTFAAGRGLPALPINGVPPAGRYPGFGRGRRPA